jgi:homogentisate phytyltransferase/homogentisate geranylgeranyltransferase
LFLASFLKPIVPSNMLQGIVAAIVAALVWRLLVRPSLDGLPRPSEEKHRDTVRGIIGFCRPHTVKGTVLATVSGYILLSIYHQSQAYMCLTLVLVSGVLANVFIVGVNQLVDVEIDKTNEKTLPLVTGELTWECGRKITGRTLVLAVTLAFFQSTLWGLTISSMCLIGIVYSVPPCRLKRFALPAALCIVLARALLATIGGVYTYSVAMGKSVDEYMQYHLFTFTGILIAFTTVIALMKDVPDIEGDEKEGVRSFSVVWGPLVVSNICFAILSGAYIIVMSRNLENKPTFFSHMYALVWLNLARQPGGTKAIAMHNYFNIMWPLFYYEFFAYLVPIALEQFHVHVECVEGFAFILGLEIAYLAAKTRNTITHVIPRQIIEEIERKSGLDIVSIQHNLRLKGSVSSSSGSGSVTEAAVEMSLALGMHAKVAKLSTKAFRDAKRLAILCGDWLLARAVIALCETKNQATIHEMGKSIIAATRRPETEIAQVISEYADKAKSHLVNS